MKAVCDTCGARYRIPDEKLKGKSLRIRCKKCGNIFKVQKGAPQAARPRAPQGEWYFSIEGESFGPYTETELLHRFESGKLGTNTYIWKQGFSHWMPVTEHTGFNAAIELSKNSMHRYGAQKSAGGAAGGSGRYTVEVQRPGATIEPAPEEREALNHEVDDAFDNLMGHSKHTATTDASDSDTPTEPMRRGLATQRPARSTSPGRTGAHKAVTARPVARKGATTSRPSRPSQKPQSARPARPQKPSGAQSAAGTSLSERLRKLREQSESTDIQHATGSFKPAERPERPEAKASATPIAPLSRKKSRTPIPDLTGDARRRTNYEDDDFTLPPRQSGPHDRTGGTEATRADTPSAPLPSGPINHPTEEIDVGDVFTGPTGTYESAGENREAPSDEDIQAFLQKRKGERTAGVPAAASQADAPPYDLPGPGRPRGKSPSIGDDATPIGGTASVGATSTASAPKRTPATATAAPTGAPAGGRVRKNTTISTFAVKAERQKQRRMFGMILLLLLGIVVLLLWLVVFRPAGHVEDTVSKNTATEEAAKTDTSPELSQKLKNIQRARNRAIGSVAKARSSAESASYIAGKEAKAERTHRRSNHNTRTARRTKPTTSDNDMGFNLGGTGAPTRHKSAKAAPKTPSASYFADALRSTVARSVGRCAQRTRATTGYLPVSRLELYISVQPDGSIRRVKSQKSASASKLMQCIRTESSRWSFRSYEGSPTTIHHPYVLR